MSVTVLLACYNGERYLPDMLDSLRKQDLADFRVLLQDDGSTDGTPALLEETEKDGRFLPAGEWGKHLGAVGNFWSLLRQDDGDYTALADQDDFWHPDRLSFCLQAMRQAEEKYGADTPLLVHSDAVLVDEAGAVLHESFFAHQGWDKTATGLNRLLVQNNVTGCTVLMNRALRQLAVKTGRPERMYMHDWFLALLAASCGRVIFLDRPLVDYRQHGENVKGASRTGLVKRGLRALNQRKKGKERIRLTYRHTADFLSMAASVLPPESRDCIETYLKTEKLPKGKRLRAVQRGGYTMQSPITRMGQRLFG